MLSAFVSLLGGLASEPGHEGTADREHLVARLCGPWATYSRIGGGSAPRAIAEGPAAAGPCSDGGQGRRSLGERVQDVDRPPDIQSLPEPTRTPRPRGDSKALRVVTRSESLDRITRHFGGRRHLRRVTARSGSPPRARRGGAGGRAG